METIFFATYSHEVFVNAKSTKSVRKLTKAFHSKEAVMEHLLKLQTINKTKFHSVNYFKETLGEMENA